MAVVAGRTAGFTDSFFSNEIAVDTLEESLGNFRMAVNEVGALRDQADCFFLLF